MVVRAQPAKSPDVWVFVEGGGNSRDEQSAIKYGFANLMAKVLVGRARPTVIPSGGRDQTYRAWERALRTTPDKLSLLLVDSEGPVSHSDDPWRHVSTRGGDAHWKKPESVHDDRLFFMVQTMEAWFIADRQAFIAYYGSKDFQLGALPSRSDVENIAKKELATALEHASRHTTKGAYRKSHGFALIGIIDPAKIRAASPHATRFFDKLLAVCPER